MKFPAFIISIGILAVALMTNSSCKKETVTVTVTDTVTVCPPVCKITGSYSGTSTPSVGPNSTLVYDFNDNNFTTGHEVVGGPITTLGGYRNTCDSVFISSYYHGNNSYYLLEGKLLNGGNTISGSFTNLTTPTDFGTFTISK
ncbi:MAG: hypothetical protein V4685_13625 [Bacteroidota bacterium]